MFNADLQGGLESECCCQFWVRGFYFCILNGEVFDSLLIEPYVYCSSVNLCYCTGRWVELDCSFHSGHPVALRGICSPYVLLLAFLYFLLVVMLQLMESSKPGN